MFGIPRDVTNPYVFFGLAGLLIAYVLYMMVRKHRAARPGQRERGPEL